MNFQFIIYANKLLNDINKTIDSIGAFFAKSQMEDELTCFEILDTREFYYQNICVLLNCHPYELSPDRFDNYLSLRDAGIRFVHVNHYSLNKQEKDMVFLKSGQILNNDIFEYIDYFFEDNDCSLLFIPALKEDELLPQELNNIPVGGVCDDVHLIVKFNFLCVVKRNLLTDGLQSLLEVPLRLAVENKRFGLLNTVALESSISIYKKIDASYLEKLIELGFLKIVQPMLDTYILDNIDQPYNSLRIHNLLQYVTKEFIQQDIKNKIKITNVSNSFESVAVSGLYYSNKKVNDLKISSNDSIVNFEVKRIEKTIRDEIFPSYSFRVNCSLFNNEVLLFFKDGRININEIQVDINNECNYRISHNKNILKLYKFAMRSQYKVSVIIPIYNAERYIQKAVDSIISQTLDFFQEIQIVLVNDGSTDGSGDICDNLANLYKYNIVSVKQKHAGVSTARNLGVSHALGEYLFFLDADDYVDPNLLLSGVKKLEKNINNNINFIAFPLKFFGVYDYDQTLGSDKFVENGIINVVENPEKVQYNASGVLFRSSVINEIKFNEFLNYGEDVEYVYQALKINPNYLVCKDSFYYYRTRYKSISKKEYNDIIYLIKHFESLFDIELEMYRKHLNFILMCRFFTEKENNKVLLDESQLAQDLMIQMMQTLDENIVKSSNKLTQDQMKYLLCLKKNATLEETISKTVIKIDYYRQKPHGLEICGYIDIPSEENFIMNAVFNDVETMATIGIDDRCAIYIAGNIVYSGCCFNLVIPRAKTTNLHDISFFIKTKHSIKKINAIVPTIQSKASDEMFQDYKSKAKDLKESECWLFVDKTTLGVTKSASLLMYEYLKRMNEKIDFKLAVLSDNILNYGDSDIIEIGSEIFNSMCLHASKILITNPSDCHDIIAQLGFIDADFILLSDGIYNENDIPELKKIAGLPISLMQITSKEDLKYIPKCAISSKIMICDSLRYINMQNEASKKILFMPSYREHLNIIDGVYNTEFAESNYVKTIGDLLLNEQLLDVCDAYGVTISFIPSKETYMYLAEYEMDDSIKILPYATPMITLAEEYAILITDTKDAFPFFYLNKPVIYYNFDMDDGAMLMDQSYGKRIERFDVLIEKLVDYIKDGLQKKGNDVCNKKSDEVYSLLFNAIKEVGAC